MALRIASMRWMGHDAKGGNEQERSPYCVLVMVGVVCGLRSQSCAMLACVIVIPILQRKIVTCSCVSLSVGRF